MRAVVMALADHAGGRGPHGKRAAVATGQAAAAADVGCPAPWVGASAKCKADGIMANHSIQRADDIIETVKIFTNFARAP